MSRLDLNLLRIFEALLATKSVSRAARALHLSQSTVSHALARLREQLDDPLFVQSRDGMQPTPRAQALAPAFGQALSLVEEAVSQRQRFVPAEAQRRFTLAGGSYFDMVLLPPLMAALAEQAPGVSLRLTGLGPSDYEKELEEGELDLVVGFAAPRHLSHRLARVELVTESLSLLSGRPLPAELSPAWLGEQQHIYPSDWGHSQLLLDNWLRLHGVERRIRLQVPDFLAVPGLLARTELVVVLPSAVARQFAEQHGLHERALPEAALRFTQVLAWHPRFAVDPGLVWLKSQILAVAAHP
ncbi:LysR family transcriptional regulator [Gallaecimonas sp. GXIMD4217]|uniref:LysR family transcriptional regulator n=1 Tax=Gallaecimonas sp. GXIMD4217 TaxID=3131927 RepID=UPI00311B3E20